MPAEGPRVRRHMSYADVRPVCYASAATLEIYTINLTGGLRWRQP